MITHYKQYDLPHVGIHEETQTQFTLPKSAHSTTSDPATVTEWQVNFLNVDYFVDEVGKNEYVYRSPKIFDDSEDVYQMIITHLRYYPDDNYCIITDSSNTEHKVRTSKEILERENILSEQNIECLSKCTDSYNKIIFSWPINYIRSGDTITMISNSLECEEDMTVVRINNNRKHYQIICDGCTLTFMKDVHGMVKLLKITDTKDLYYSLATYINDDEIDMLA